MSGVLERFSLSGEIALVTGASSGIGQSLALALAEAGASIIAVARREPELTLTCERVRAAGGEAIALCADLSRGDDLETLAARCRAGPGSPGILVNAAGINLREPPEAISRASWDLTLGLNLSAPFFLARALLPGMLQRGRGKIINIASLQSRRAFANGMAYGASKGGVEQLTRAMAEAWSPHGVCANAIAPGFFPTPLTRQVFEHPELGARLAAQTAIGRNGELEDLHGAAVFLAARASDYVTGQVLFVDGGFTAR